MRPVILVTADRLSPEPVPVAPNAFGRIRPPRPKVWVYEAYTQAVRDAGGWPLVVPPGPSDVDMLLARCDGVLLTGGDMDIHPSWYGEEVLERLDRVEPARTDLEMALAEACLARDIPILGVCGGLQILVVAAGGSLIQDVPATVYADRVGHEQLTDPATPSHGMRLEGPAVAWLGREVQVNSTHHQAVKALGALEACGWAPDGLVEVVVHPGKRFAAGVQWHPELLGQLGPYEALIAACRRA